MSGIAGIYQADGSPASEALLLRMQHVIRHRGPDGAGTWSLGSIGLAYQSLHSTEESVSEKQPMTNGRGLWIAADCRIDNRDELERKFRSRGLWRWEGVVPDPAYILSAYELWGEEAPGRLLGDFAFALWDGLSRKLFCARDQVGLKPFVYHWNGRRFLFGSEMKQIFQDAAVSRDLNLPHLADLLVMRFPNRQETPYRAVRRLPAAHSISIQGSRFQIRKYWHWDPEQEPVSTASLEENGEIFLSLFQRAVQDRLRVPSGNRVGSLLSGGLDSSSITAVAASLDGGGSSLPVFHKSYPEANPAYRLQNFDWVDESVYVEAVLQKYPLEFHRIEVRGLNLLGNLEENFRIQEIPLPFPNYASTDRMCQAVGGKQVRSLLHGEGGDELFSIGPNCLFGDFRKGKFPEFRRHWAEKRSNGEPAGDILAAFGKGLIPEFLKKPYRVFFRKIVPDYIRPGLARSVRLRERIAEDALWEGSFQASSLMGIRQWLSRASISLGLETLERCAAFHRMEFRFPYADVRLFRFCASLPCDQKRRGNTTKILLRQALGDLLPLRVRNRLGKSEYTPVIRTALERTSGKIIAETFQTPHPAFREMVDLREGQKLCEDFFSGKRVPVWPVWWLVIVDRWLKYEDGFYGKEEKFSEKKIEFLGA